MSIQVEMRLEVPCEVSQEGKWYVASCPVLDVYSQGETEEKAKANLAEAVSAFLISCFERGTLDAVFKQCGFRALESSGGYIRRTDSDSLGSEYLKIPLPFVVNSSDQELCHA